MAEMKKFFNANNNDVMGVTKVCVRCKRMFSYLGFGHYYCPSCKKLDDEDFSRVKNYIFDHGIASASEVSDMTSVSIKTIEQYLREGRLEIPEESPIFIKCEKCSVDIRSGRLCMECARKLSSAMRERMDFDDEQIGEVPKKKIGKMRFIGNKK